MKFFAEYNKFMLSTKKKPLSSVLNSLYGVNLKSQKKVFLLNGFDITNRNIDNITVDQFNLLKTQANFFYNLEKNKIFNNVLKKKKIKNYSGMRHILKLPVKGQRTHTNSKTARKNFKKEI